jgi:hypothetical protein
MIAGANEFNRRRNVPRFTMLVRPALDDGVSREHDRYVQGEEPASHLQQKK